MGALDNVVPFELPKRKPRVIEKDAPPVQRSFCVIPWRAVIDKRLTPHQLKTLAAIASYCNKAGITWVSLQKVGQDLGVTKQAVSKHYKLLIEYGYIRIINRGFSGIRGNTIQVVFNEELSVEDVIAKASIGTEEDLRPPVIREQQEREAMRKEEEISEAQARENQKRLAEMLKTAFKTPSEANKQIYKPVKGDTMTVRKMKEEIAKAKKQRQPLGVDTKPVDNSVDKSSKPVDNLLHSQLSEGRICQPLGVDQRKKTGIDKDIYIGLEYIKDKVKYYCSDDITESNLRFVEMLDQIKATDTELDLVGQAHKGLTVRRYVELVIDLASKRKV